MNNHRGHIPLRTCVICRVKKAKNKLIRLVLDKDNRIVIDDFQQEEGRGIYLCDEGSCMAKLSKNKGLKRFFRTDKAVTVGFDSV